MRFRIERQDGFARIGELNGIKTPHLIDLRDEEDIEFFRKIAERKPPAVAEKIFPSSLDFLKKEGIVRKITLKGANPREFVEMLLSRRDFKVPLYIPLIASPQNLSMLIYAGADIADNAYALSKAHEGVFLTEIGEFRLDELRDVPCHCPACSGREEYRSEYEYLADHNTFALRRERLLSVKMLRSERLRDLVELRVKSNPELTAIMRIIDSKTESSAFFPRFRKSKLFPTSEDSPNRPEIQYYFQRLPEVYDPASHICLLIPCSARKPYLISKTHRILRSRLGRAIRGVNEIIISSPFVSPRELELIYPVSLYDTPTTGMWSEWEIDFVSSRLAPLLDRFERIYAHLHSGYRKVAEKAGEKAGADIEFVDDVRELKRKLESEERSDFDLYHEMFRHMMRYQFGLEFGIERVKGKYPSLEFFRKERVARIDARYGNLDVYGELAVHLKERGVFCVEIDEFDVRGTIFSVGVRKADRNIRPNDVAVYFNSGIVGVGKALMPGKLMGEVDGRAIESRRKVISLS